MSEQPQSEAIRTKVSVDGAVFDLTLGEADEVRAIVELIRRYRPDQQARILAVAQLTLARRSAPGA